MQPIIAIMQLKNLLLAIEDETSLRPSFRSIGSVSRTAGGGTGVSIWVSLISSISATFSSLDEEDEDASVPSGLFQ